MNGNSSVILSAHINPWDTSTLASLCSSSISTERSGCVTNSMDEYRVLPRRRALACEGAMQIVEVNVQGHTGRVPQSPSRLAEGCWLVIIGSLPLFFIIVVHLP